MGTVTVYRQMDTDCAWYAPQRIVLQKVEGVVHAQYACSCMHAALLAVWPKQHPRSNITVYTISISDSMKATNCSVVSGSRKKIRGTAVEI